MSIILIFLLLAIGYFVLYFGGRRYLENFKTQDNLHRDWSQMLPDMPYTISPIDNIDNYEVSAVYQNQGSKEVSKQQINDAMTRYPLDWAGQGPASQFHQENQTQSQSPIGTSSGASTIVSNAMILKDSNMDEEEKKFLKTYVPSSSKDLLQYSVYDVKEIANKIYNKKGLIPVIKKSKQGPNVWEIVEVKEKNPKIVWEDEVQPSGVMARDVMEQRGEEVIIVPQSVGDMTAGMDPFFNAKPSMKRGKNDYTQWTPGLERMFAPTYPVKAWY